MKRQAGYSLLEIMLIVGVISIAMVGIVNTYRTTTAKERAIRYSDATSVLIVNLETGIGQMQSYYGLNNSTAVARHFVPSEFERGSSLATSWGAISIQPVGIMNNGIRLTFENVQPASCVEFVSRVSPLMQQVQVNGQVVSLDRKPDVSTLSRLCDRGGTVVMDRYENAFGRKAMWETWVSTTPPSAGEGSTVPLPIEPTPQPPILRP